jgi:excinuclease ABC subunit C
VASLVVFVDGYPKKSQYRRYTIRSVEGIDDFAAMREVVTRRVRRLVEEKSDFPDLFLIDGGKGQLRAALESLEKWGKGGQEIIGLAKRLEEVYRPGIQDPIMIPRVSPGLKLLQQVRNESHRFAIAFQKSKRRKYIRKIWLDEIQGVGPKTIKKLLNRFGSPEKVRCASEQTLAECVGKALAAKIARWRQRP